jgi:hypothetical protein
VAWDLLSPPPQVALWSPSNLALDAGRDLLTAQSFEVLLEVQDSIERSQRSMIARLNSGAPPPVSEIFTMLSCGTGT